MKLVTFDDGKVGRLENDVVSELDDRLAFHAADLAVVERDEPHARPRSHATTSAAFSSGGKTG